MSREKYLPGPTDVAALALGGESDDETATRREAVQAALGYLQQRRGAGSTLARTLRERAFDVDGGETVESAREGWTEYVRPALVALDTVETVGDGRWRYVGASKAAPTERAADLPGSDVSAALTADEQASLSQKEIRREHAAVAFAAATDHSVDEVREKLDSQEFPRPEPSDDLRESNRNLDAALASGAVDRGPTPSPNGPGPSTPSPTERDETDERMLDSDARLSKRVSWRPDALDSVERASLDASGSESESDSDSDADDRTCAVCDETQPVGTRLVDAPVMDARFAADGSDKLCKPCFASLATGERTDGL